jgi:hypothetical protein
MILFLRDIYISSRKRRHQELIPRDTKVASRSKRKLMLMYFFRSSLHWETCKTRCIYGVVNQ